jgi:hypothetical protein
MACEPSQPAKMGRPSYDRMKIVNDFVNWARTNPDAWTVPQFAVEIGINSGMMNEWAAADEEFSRAFSQGKEYIGINRLKSAIPKSGEDKAKMDRGIYLRGIGNYDKDQNIHDREEKQFEIECKAKVDKDSNTNANADIVDRLDKTLSQISSLQESVRNKAASNIKRDEKS